MCLMIPPSRVRDFWQSVLDKQSEEKASMLFKLCVPFPAAMNILSAPEMLSQSNLLNFGVNFTSVDPHQI